MKYTTGGVRSLGGDRWKARFTYYEGDKKREICRNFRCAAKSKNDKAVTRKVAEIHSALEAQAQLDALYSTVEPVDKTVSEYMDEYIARREAAGAIELTTLANYRRSAQYVTRYMGKVKLSDQGVHVNVTAASPTRSTRRRASGSWRSSTTWGTARCRLRSGWGWRAACATRRSWGSSGRTSTSATAR